jgi:hypothetical protein
MKLIARIAAPAGKWALLLVLLAGCSTWCNGVARRTERRTPTDPLGVQSDQIWRRQAAGAAASQFMVYQHEFVKDGVRLNMGGEDHLKSIAARLHAGECLPVMVERSMTSKRLDTKYQYPVNPNPELDMKRREVVVASLVALGIPNADQCVVVSPALSPGVTATEAARAYNRGLATGTSNFGGGRGAPGAGIAGDIGDAGSSDGGVP